MRFKNIYIFIIILSLLMPETTSENTDPSSEEKKGWSLFKRKNKEYKEKSDRKGFLGIFKRKRKKDAEEDLIVTEEERKRQETKDGQEIVRIPFTPMEESDEVLSSSQSRKEEIPESNLEELPNDVNIDNDLESEKELDASLEQISDQGQNSNDSKKNKEIYIYQDRVVDSKVDEGPSWPFTLSSNDESESEQVAANENLETSNVAPSQSSKASTQNISLSESPINNSQNQLLQTIIDQNKKIDLLIATLNKDPQLDQFDTTPDTEILKESDLNSGDSQDMLELLKIVQNKFFEIESMVSGSDSLFTTAHNDIKSMMIKMESMNMRLETKIQSLELSLGLLETDLAVRVDSLEQNMSSRDSRIDELESLNKDLVMQMLKLDNKLAAKVIKLENKMLELDSGYTNLKDLNKDLVFNVLNQNSPKENDVDDIKDEKSSLKISKSEYKKRYDEAYTRYLDGDYNKALSMFGSLLELENINDLTDNCQYWVGEIYYATRDFRNAIDAFNQVFKFEDNNKNSYSQYKLGLCYLNVNEKQNAVNAFQKVVDNYPKQSDLVRKSKNFIQKYK